MKIITTKTLLGLFLCFGGTQGAWCQEPSTLQAKIDDAGIQPVKIVLDKDYTENLSIAKGQDITIDLNGKTLTSATGESAILVYGKLTVDDNTATGDITYDESTNTISGTYTSGVITGCNNGTATEGSNGGGIDVFEGGELVFNNGTIKDNIAYNGGAIYGYHCNITINGGYFTNNKALRSSGGGGGAIYPQDSNATINGGYYIGNYAMRQGGAMFGSGKKSEGYQRIITNGLFFGNKASSGGGIGDNGTITISGGTIAGNEALYTGFAYIHGGGLFVNYDADAILTGGKIINNKATSFAGDSEHDAIIAHGGGVYVGGVYFYNGVQRTNISFEMRGGEVSGNSVDDDELGSALFLDSYVHAAISGGRVDGTLAKGLTNCDITILGGDFDKEANTGTATTDSGRFKASDFLASNACGTTDDNDGTYKVTMNDIIINDKEEYDNRWTINNVNVSYTRTLSNKVGTIVLPFTPKPNNNIKFYAFGDTEAKGDVLTLYEVRDIEPNKAYIYKYQGEITDGNNVGLTLEADNTTIYPNTIEPNECGNWTIMGTYTTTKKNGQTDGSFYYVNAKDGIMYKAEGNTNFAPYRAWATYNGTSQAKAFHLYIDGEVTGIATIRDGKTTISLGKIYDLNGCEVTLPQHGNTYIINGKKIKY